MLGRYEITAADVRGQCAEIEADPATYAAIDNERFDPHARLAFYEDLVALPDHLVDACPCPLYFFWGDEDTDAVAMVMSNSELSRGLTDRGVTHHIVRGFDHEVLNAQLEVAWPEASRLAHAPDLCRRGVLTDDHAPTPSVSMMGETGSRGGCGGEAGEQSGAYRSD